MAVEQLARGAQVPLTNNYLPIRFKINVTLIKKYLK